MASDSNPTACTVTLNLSNPYLATSVLHSESDFLFVNVVIPIMMSIGILGNSAFIYTVFRVRSMQTVTNAYLVNMAVADIIFISSSLITVCAYFISPVANDAFFKSWIGCTVSWDLPYMLYFTSLLSVSFVTIERYCAICKPLQHRVVTGKKRTIRFITSTWICGILFGVSVTPSHGNLASFCVVWPDIDEYKNFPQTIQYCVPFTSVPGNVFAQVVQILPFLIAMLGNFYMYWNILKVLGSRPGEEYDVGNQNRFKVIRKQVARLLILNGIVFFVCQTPFRFINIEVIMMYTLGSGMFDPNQFATLIPVGRTMIMINSCVNVFIYLATSSFYRRAFSRAFGCRNISQMSTITDNGSSNTGNTAL